MRILIAAAVALVGLMAPAGALASGGGQSGGSQGVHTDPNSPAARQYVLPVQAARNEAGGGGQPGGQGTNVPHPFGAGVSAPPSHHTTTTSRSTPRHKPPKPHTPRAGATPRMPVPATVSPGGYAAPVSGKESASTNGGSGWLPLIGGGLLVLLLGGGGGLVLRRRLSTSST